MIRYVLVSGQWVSRGRPPITPPPSGASNVVTQTVEDTV